MLNYRIGRRIDDSATGKVPAWQSQIQTRSQGPRHFLDFDTIPIRIFGGSPFVIAAEASSGLPITFTSITPAVCRTASNLVMLPAALLDLQKMPDTSGAITPGSSIHPAWKSFSAPEC
jgi:hypothetical protein